MILTQAQDILSNLPFKNLDLLSLLGVIASIAILGFITYNSNKQSITNRSFFYFSLATIFWGIFNYLNYQTDSVVTVLWLLRFLMFFAVWISFTLFQLLYVFPSDNYVFPKIYRYLVIPWVGIVSVLTLTPYVFNHINGTVEIGKVANVAIGPGIIIFAATVFTLIGSGIATLVYRMTQSSGVTKKKIQIILLGVVISFTLIVSLDFISAAFYEQYQFIPFGAFFIFPLVVCTAYAIYKHQLFNIRAAAIAALTFVLCLSTIIEVIFSSSTVILLLRSGIFLLVLGVSILMNRFVQTIAEQKDELQKSNEGKTNLIHIMNHQIKGYLSKSRNIFSELLSEPDYQPANEEARKMISEGFNSLTEGVGFIQQVLNGSSAESGQLQYLMAPINLEIILKEVAEKQKDTAIIKNLTYEVDVLDGHYETIGDNIQLRECVRNLIDNSIQYTMKGGLIIILKRVGDNALLSIKDSGVGITEEDKLRLFTIGGRGKNSLKVNVNSTGYGLAFVKAVVEAHKGRVWAESEGEGKGSTFYLELPIVKK